MAWLILVLSGLLEAGWALSLKASNGFTKLWPTVSFGVLMILSMAGLAYALKSLPVGVAYAVWTGIGAATTAIIAVFAFGETMNVVKAVSLVLIVAGIVGLNLSGGGH